MTLRTRLILWLLLLSVVPLGAVTVYTYVSSARALRVAAAREADLLAGELSSRMQLVTAELSSRVEELMRLPAAQPARPTPAATKPVTATPAPAPAAAATAADTKDDTVDQQVATALGDAAMLLDSVELQGMREIFRGARGGRPNDPTQTGGRGRIGDGQNPTGGRANRPGDAVPVSPGGRGDRPPRFM